MTDKISMARQRLRDYALTAHAVQLNQVLGCAWVADPPDIPDGLTISISRGEAGAKAFMAAQEALRVAEELRAESREPVTTKVEVHGRSIPYPPDSAYKDALAAAADRIEAAIFLALG
jgi:predicted RNase H-like HicB family nuclease